MSVPVIICDDSAVARKSLARALPAGWDVTLTLASGGAEALSAIREGKGDILFLDLTMPEVDGFAVLEAIRREDLPTMVIVVSGDIQPESQRRVAQLGAVAFLKKPVNSEELTTVLRDYGVLGVLSPTAVLPEMATDFSDWIQELFNVAMGRSADLLAAMIGEPVEMQVPEVSQITPQELDQKLAKVVELTDSGEGLSLVSQGFIGGGISGETLLFFQDHQAADLAALMGYAERLDHAAEVELLTEVGNILVGALLRGIADQLDIHFSQGQPQIRNVDGADRSPPLRCRLQPPATLLRISFGFRIGHAAVHCRQSVLLTETSLARLQQLASYILE